MNPGRFTQELGNEGYVLKQIKDTLDLHVSISYESISREVFLDMAKRKDIPITSLGRWWSKNEEIDLVALDDENRTIWFGECKWSNRKVGTDVYKDLRRRSEQVDWHAGKRNERFVLFSRSGFTPAMLDLAKREKVILAEGESTHRRPGSGRKFGKIRNPRATGKEAGQARQNGTARLCD